ncbi:MAG: DUF1385 domain-containing protein [Ruminococcus sp.]|jgi:uncharacterized protein YqhQ|nr:DUF1385 domain-containing protein [Ruminococcus sp.]
MDPKKNKIGGQALISGIMMRGPKKTAMAVRMPDKSIDVEEWDNYKTGEAPWFTKVPFLRGCFNFVLSLYTGIRCTIKSAEKASSDSGGEDEEAEEMSAFERRLEEKFGPVIEKHFNAIMLVVCIFTVLLSVLVFKFVPTFLSGLLGYVNAPDILKTVVEGVVKFALICTYMYLVSKTSAMKELFGYHGAEHKTIACFESGEELTVENIRTKTRFHPRCGTSFILIVIILSICIGLFLPWTNIWVRYGLQLLLLIPESAVAYELIRFAGKHDNVVTKVISAPGLWLQHITTNEPDDSMIEVAIAAVSPVIKNIQ